MTGDRNFNIVLKASVVMLLLLTAGIFITLLYNSIPTINKLGFDFVVSKVWDPVAGEYGALPFIVGTLTTSFLALIISFPFAIVIAIFLGEYFTSGFFHNAIKSAVELLAGIPSIVYGFWGLFIFVPVIRDLEMQLGVLPYGIGIFTSSVILAIMIIPYSASISYEVINLVPADIKEAAYSLGATRFEVIRKVVVPYSSSGIVAGVLLSLGRALGETMAVTMVIGNSNIMPENIFAPGNTMASVIANEFTEATGEQYLSALIEIGLLLFLITAIVNFLGKYIIRKLSHKSK